MRFCARCGMPAAVVGDGQLGALVDGVDGHGDAGALRGVGEGVVEQDTDDLPHPVGVGDGDHRPVRRAQLQARAAQVGTGAELARHVAGQRAEVDAADRHHDPAGVELGEVEQVGGELGQPLDLLAHRAHELGPLLRARVLLVEQLDEAAEAEDRRAQLVRGVGDELLAGAVELGEAALHLVEGAGELAELAGGVDRDAGGEVAVGDRARRVLDPPHPLRDHLGGVEADAERRSAGRTGAPTRIGPRGLAVAPDRRRPRDRRRSTSRLRSTATRS